VAARLKSLHNAAMADIASVLKIEISRVARKALRTEIAGLRKAITAYRSEIADLKRRAQALERDVRRLGKGGNQAVAAETPVPAARFSAKSLSSQRQRLGLSAHDCGLLIGASGQSVYNWEDGKARPRVQHLAAIAALRTLGKREAAARLAALREASGA
jgi:DNA-binding transcriptional regulator YiaG